MVALTTATTAEAAECFKNFGARKGGGSDWSVATLQSLVRADRGDRCNVVGFQFDYALVAPYCARGLTVADLADREMYRLKLDRFGLAWESWVGFFRAYVIALDPEQGFRLGYYASGVPNDFVAVSSAIDDLLSAHDSLIDFRWVVKARR